MNYKEHAMKGDREKIIFILSKMFPEMFLTDDDKASHLMQLIKLGCSKKESMEMARRFRRTFGE